eukprot:scaffold1734_cov113-Isochrysis_galbana.AAC.11
MTPEDREPDAPDMPHADTHTPLHGPTGGVPSPSDKRQGTLRHPTAPFARGGAGAEERAMPVAAARMGRLTTIKPGAAAVAGLPSGAIGGAMAGTPPNRGNGARIAIASAGPAAP